MNRKSIFFISFAAISIYVCTILFFSIKIGLSASQGKLKTQEQFTLLVQDTIDLLEVHYGINDTFITNYTSTIQKHETIGAVLISDTEHMYFAYPLQSKLITQDSSDHFSIKSSSSFISVYSATIPLEFTGSLTITAALYHITPFTMYRIARTAFMIILVTTLSIFLIIFFQNILKKDNQKEVIANDTDISNNSLITPQDSDSVINLEESFLEQPIATITTPEVEISNEIIEEVILDTPSKDTESILGEKVSDPLGLFSKETGFGWESYLETRLDSELARAASSEQDLALIIIRIKGSTRKEAYIRQVSSILIDTFKFRDLIFEFGTDGFACILQEIDLDMTMKLCERLYTSLHTALEASSVDNRIGIGISTRTLRIIPGSRILQESSQACDKSFEEEGLPIVAFRVSPDRYRKFLSEVENN